MADPSPAAAAPAQDNGGTLAKVAQALLRAMVLSWIIQAGAQYFTAKPSAPTAVQPDHGSTAPPPHAAGSGPFHVGWPSHEPLTLSVHLVKDAAIRPSQANLVWRHAPIYYGDWTTHEHHALNVTLPRNASMYAHLVLGGESRAVVVSRSVPLVQFLKPPKRAKKVKLISTSAQDASAPQPEEDLQTPAESIAHWSGNLTVNMVGDRAAMAPSQIPPPLAPWIDFDLETNTYKPILWPNHFWTLHSDLIPLVNETTTLPLHLQFYPLSLFKWQLYLTMDHSLQQQAAMMSLGLEDTTSASHSEATDEFKRMLRDTNPALLALTVTVSVLHSVFEFLAFKNDVAFWKNRKSVRGISVRSMVVNLGIQAIIFLYLLDNAQATSYVVLISNAVGLAIETWKVSRAVRVRVRWHRRGPFSVPTLHLVDKKSYRSTRAHDAAAFRMMQWLIYPLLVAYAVYSLIYHEHKGWYSWVVSTLVGFVYAFGFLQSLPQLFVNYRLKSVAHMNGRTLTYKFLTTIIDDLYSFVIKMPTWHRIAVFRDDVVFVVFLIQRYLYRVDYTRANEYGQGGDPGAENEEEDEFEEEEEHDAPVDEKMPLDEPKHALVEPKKDK